MDREWKPQHKEHQAYTPPPKAGKGQNRMLTRDASGRKLPSAPVTIPSEDDRYDDSKPSRKQAAFEGKPNDGAGDPADGGKPFALSDIRPVHWKIIGGVLVFFLLLFLVIIPGFRGFTVYQAMKESGVPDTYLTDMTALQQAKSDAESSLATAKAQLDSCESTGADERSRLARDNENLNAAIDVCAQDAAAARDEADACEDTKSEQDAVIQNAANRLCCIARVENSAINAYAIADEKITCVGEGGTAISC